MSEHRQIENVSLFTKQLATTVSVALFSSFGIPEKSTSPYFSILESRRTAMSAFFSASCLAWSRLDAQQHATRQVAQQNALGGDRKTLRISMAYASGRTICFVLTRVSPEFFRAMIDAIEQCFNSGTFVAAKTMGDLRCCRVK